MSADEESFIVLEETPSLLQFSILDSPTFKTQRELYDNNVSIDSNNSLCGNESHENDVAEGQSKQQNKIENAPSKTHADEANFEQRSIMAAQNVVNNTVAKKQILHEVNAPTPSKTTLAQSFLLGDINCDIMKSYFPMNGNLNHGEDTEKWQNLVQERNELKDALQRTNATMRQQHFMVNEWQHGVKGLKENHEAELKKFQTINDELFQQNYDLQTKVVELQHLAELSRKTRIQSEKDQTITDKLKIEQLEKQVQNLKLELANTIAINVETDEAYRESTKKCEKLDVELVAIQELYKNASAEIVSLKTQNECLHRELEQTKVVLDECRNNTKVIQTQCDVYRIDFELERKQREEMASEREQMIADIRMLKSRNQALVDEAQSYYKDTSVVSLSSTGPNVSIEDNNEAPNFICPLCSQSYENFNQLESHVQSCLERNG